MNVQWKLLKGAVGLVSAAIAAELICIGANAAIDDAKIIKENYASKFIQETAKKTKKGRK